MFSFDDLHNFCFLPALVPAPRGDELDANAIAIEGCVEVVGIYEEILVAAFDSDEPESPGVDLENPFGIVAGRIIGEPVFTFCPANDAFVDHLVEKAVEEFVLIVVGDIEFPGECICPVGFLAVALEKI
jgi:hypothetical protein